jgi:hypothetical protein
MASLVVPSQNWSPFPPCAWACWSPFLYAHVRGQGLKLSRAGSRLAGDSPEPSPRSSSNPSRARRVSTARTPARDTGDCPHHGPPHESRRRCTSHGPSLALRPCCIAAPLFLLLTGAASPALPLTGRGSSLGPAAKLHLIILSDLCAAPALLLFARHHRQPLRLAPTYTARRYFSLLLAHPSTNFRWRSPQLHRRNPNWEPCCCSLAPHPRPLVPLILLPFPPSTPISSPGFASPHLSKT